MRTRAELVSIQAISPESSLKAGDDVEAVSWASAQPAISVAAITAPRSLSIDLVDLITLSSFALN